MLVTPILHGSFMDSNKQYTQEDRSLVLKEGQTQEELILWKNDKGISHLSLVSFEEKLENLTINLSAFTNAHGQVLNDIEVFQVMSTLAYSGYKDSTNNQLPKGNRLEANEILVAYTSKNLERNSLINFWLTVNTDTNTQAGKYQGQITVTADNLAKPLIFQVTLSVLDLSIQTNRQGNTSFDLELWQNPYAVAEYYDVEVFSSRHFDILKPHMELYKSLGGNTITASIIEEAWNGQTYSRHDIKFPSMIRWELMEDQSFHFNYEDFDAWIEFNHALGLGDKIICYSILPWTNQLVYYDHTSQQKQKLDYEIGDERYKAIWTLFLTDFIQHVESKGWKNNIYMGIDERGFDQEVFDFLNCFVGMDGLALKTSGAIDHLESNEEIALALDILSVGTMAIKDKPLVFEEIRRIRSGNDKATYTYSCTGHQPGNFSLSLPAESYWTILYTYSVGANGFLRWAFDSWVEDPLKDSTHRAFEAGDCFLVYPDERYKQHPISRSSTRMEKLAEGIRDLGKLTYFVENHPLASLKLQELLVNIPASYESKDFYLTKLGKEKIVLDMARIKQELNQLSLMVNQAFLKEGVEYEANL